ncbi:hypothetical protein JCM4814A_81180 [Streptomyces phaeofaciens JCM 4814]|uniref:Uncharacterized protein n=1 Tax=Streptomyces phaeofaciens TaxID=68254 RepID=A0A918HSX1_9ACTN|nr:hypothetical protein GCM10010226_90720 [Streptomyces phaeofaciens]
MQHSVSYGVGCSASARSYDGRCNESGQAWVGAARSECLAARCRSASGVVTTTCYSVHPETIRRTITVLNQLPPAGKPFMAGPRSAGVEVAFGGGGRTTSG